jgi:hypothetical protein
MKSNQISLQIKYGFIKLINFRVSKSSISRHLSVNTIEKMDCAAPLGEIGAVCDICAESTAPAFIGAAAMEEVAGLACCGAYIQLSSSACL